MVPLKSEIPVMIVSWYLNSAIMHAVIVRYVRDFALDRKGLLDEKRDRGMRCPS